MKSLQKKNILIVVCILFGCLLTFSVYAKNYTCETMREIMQILGPTCIGTDAFDCGGDDDLSVHGCKVKCRFETYECNCYGAPE